MKPGRNKRNWRTHHKQKRKSGTFDYEKVYLHEGGWRCVIGRIGEPRQVLGPYATQELAQAEADGWKNMRLVRVTLPSNQSPIISDAKSTPPPDPHALF